jgi:hypothetical protein
MREMQWGSQILHLRKLPKLAGLASSGSVNTPESLFLRSGSKRDDPNMFSDRLDDRNRMAESIIHFGHF